jgi:hypothetical protein
MEWTTRDVAADPRATRARWTRSAAETSSGSGADDGFFASWSTPVFVVAACVAALAVARFADRRVGAAVRAHCFVAWTLALIMVGIVPTDVTATLRAGEAPRGLDATWDVAYWSTYALTWIVLPLHQCYVDAADFSSVGRLKRAARENAMFLGIAATAMFVGAAALLATESLSLDAMRAYGIVVANVWGISTGVLLMGFGLVDVPRAIWRRAAFNNRLTRSYKRVAGVSRALGNAHARLARQVVAVTTTSRVMPRRHSLRWAMSVIENETPEFSEMHRGSLDEALDATEEDVLDYDYDELNDLVALRRAVRRSLRQYDRTKAQYVIAVKDAFEAEAAEQSRASSTRRLHRPPNSVSRSGSLGKCMDDVQYTWSIVIVPVLLRVIATGLAFFSVSIIIAESSIWIGKVWEEADQISLLSVMLENAEDSTSGLTSMHVVVAFPLAYMCLCTFHSLHKLGMFSFYTLVPRHTDAFSLLVNASLVCRYSAPLSFNFLMLLPIIRASGKMTTFSRKMANNVPELAGELNIIVPTFLGLYCVAIALGWFDRIARVLNVEGFKFDSDKDVNESTETGKSIVDRERAEVMDGAEIGSSHESFVSETAPREQRLPPIASNSNEWNDVEHDARGGLLSTYPDPESASARWETQKARLAQATQASAARAVPRGSPLSRTGRDKVSELDFMFSNLGRRSSGGESFSDE